jgi:hypothetical protein
MIYLLTASGLPPGGSCTIHIYTQAIYRTTLNKQYTERHKTNNTQNNTKFEHNTKFENNTKSLEECGPCPDLASYTLAFALQLRKKYGKTSWVDINRKCESSSHDRKNPQFWLEMCKKKVVGQQHS